MTEKKIFKINGFDLILKSDSEVDSIQFDKTQNILADGLFLTKGFICWTKGHDGRKEAFKHLNNHLTG